MKRLKILIERIFTKKNIKIFLLLFVIVWFFVWTSFAQSESWWAESMTLVQKVSYFMHILISILSWWWVVFATLAWKFMTNDFVYGTFLHLDEVLWNLWNIIKNFANIALWCILIFAIVKNLFSVDDKSPIQRVKDTVIHTMIAWVLIQMSWFLIAALFDLSTIATVAVWSLPSQFMAVNTDFQRDMITYVADTNTKVIVDFNNQWNIVETIKTSTGVTEDELNKFLDTITPSSETVVWPLLLLWSSAFNMIKLSDSSRNESDSDDWWDLLLSLWINWFVMVSFTLMLALMFLFNLFRVITLWVVIPLTPFIILFSVFKKDWKNFKLSGFLWDVTDYSKIIKLIFKPVYMTLVLSIVLIVMILVKSLIKANWTVSLANDNITLQSSRSANDSERYNSSMEVASVANIQMNNMKETFADLFLYFLWLAMMCMLVKSSFSWDVTWIKFIDEKISWISKMLWGEKWSPWWIMWNMWVLPLWKDENGKTVNVWLWATWNYIKWAQSRLDTRLYNKEAAQDAAIRKAMSADDVASGAYDSLKTTSLNQKQWIEQAANISIAKNYTTEKQIINDDSFRAAKQWYKDHAKLQYGEKHPDEHSVFLKMQEINEKNSEQNGW